MSPMLFILLHLILEFIFYDRFSILSLYDAFLHPLYFHHVKFPSKTPKINASVF
ncbi:hypothetical protein KSF78_0007811 [Schistosoma japonicum]|nr:hypothetical protein KSF78_0007811 [Schistosoma japonicum]